MKSTNSGNQAFARSGLHSVSGFALGPRPTFTFYPQFSRNVTLPELPAYQMAEYTIGSGIGQKTRTPDHKHS